MAKRTVRLLGVLMTVAAASPPTPIMPGQWEITTQPAGAAFDGRPDNSPAMPSRAMRVCITPEAAGRGPGLASPSDSCTVADASLENGHYAYVLKCKAEGSTDTILTRVTGHYSDTQYDGRTVSLQRRGQMRIAMRSTISARRVGDCPTGG